VTIAVLREGSEVVLFLYGSPPRKALPARHADGGVIGLILGSLGLSVDLSRPR